MTVPRSLAVGCGVFVLTALVVFALAPVPGPPVVQLLRSVRDGSRLVAHVEVTPPCPIRAVLVRDDGNPLDLGATRVVPSPLDPGLIHTFVTDAAGTSALRLQILAEPTLGRTWRSDDVSLAPPPRHRPTARAVELRTYGDYSAFCPLDVMRRLTTRHPEGLPPADGRAFARARRQWFDGLGRLPVSYRRAFFDDWTPPTNDDVEPDGGRRFFERLAEARRRFRAACLDGATLRRLHDRGDWPDGYLMAAGLLFGRDDLDAFVDRPDVRAVLPPPSGWRRRPVRRSVPPPPMVVAMLGALARSIPDDLGLAARLGPR